MSSSEGSPPTAGEVDNRQGPPVVISCLRQRADSFLEVANGFEGVTAELLPLDTEDQALAAATKYCVWEGLKNKKEPLPGARGVAADMLKHREEFPVIAISGMEAEGLDILYRQVEVLERKKHPRSRLSDEEYLAAEQALLADTTALLKEARARRPGVPL